jgi:hypothetical protein
MKRSIIGLLTAAVIGLSGVFVAQANNYPNLGQAFRSTVDYLECNYGQCNAIAKSTNERCKHCVSNEGDLYCWQH